MNPRPRPLAFGWLVLLGTGQPAFSFDIARNVGLDQSHVGGDAPTFCLGKLMEQFPPLRRVPVAHNSCPPAGVSLPSAVSGAAAEGLGSKRQLRSPQDVKKERHAHRLGRLAAKNKAANILKTLNEKDAVRVSHCGYVARQSLVELQRNPATEKAGFDGLKTCGSVWWCPVCSPRIAEKRREELNALLAAARAEGLAVVMLSLTARHSRKTQLVPFLDALKRAKQRLRRRRDWAALPFVGSVTVTEVTYGKNGWHPHFHEIILLECAQADAVAHIETLRAGWLVSLEAEGQTGEKAAFQVQNASAAGNYVAKFGAAEEMTLANEKRGRDGSRNPWQLLDDARDGDAQASAIWAQYAAAFKGRRQLVWSNGLKARFGIGETSDLDAAAIGEQDTPPEPVTLRVWLGSGTWREARRRRAALLFAAEAQTCLDAAEFGPTDAETWRRHHSGQVLE